MPRYNVEYNGKWACFSSIVDAFVTGFMDKTEYEEWRKKEYGLHDYEPAEKRNMMSMEEAISFIRLNRTHKEAVKCLSECGLSKEVCEQMICNEEDVNYSPVPKQNGKYKCPNCGEEVQEGQKECKGEFCCLEFVWKK